MQKIKKVNSDTRNEKTLGSPQHYFNRELSWLEFNRRVLHESFNETVPLLERLKFSAIFSTNLDEFFMVRVAGLKEQVEAGVDSRTPDGLTPAQQLAAIRDRLYPMVLEQQGAFQQTLRSLLAEKGVYLLDYLDLGQEQINYLHHYFETKIFPVLTPLAVDPGHPFPHISNLSLNLALVVRDPEMGQEHFARLKVPGSLPRFIPMPAELQVAPADLPTAWTGVPLEQVIAHNLEALFPGLVIQECHAFRVTRHADLALEEDEADDLLLAIEKGLRQQRLGGSVVRLEVQESISEAIQYRLMDELELQPNDIYPVPGPLGLRDLMFFLSLPLPELKDIPWMPVVPLAFQRYSDLPANRTFAHATLNRDEREDLFSVIRKQDILLHHPYHSFSGTLQRFIKLAANDPAVLAIKMTLYRTSGDSPIVQALITAAENGKQVVALVELKARFDEANNINWARQLENAGVHVVYGLVGLKTHTKITMVVRREEGTIRRYVHIGTGNYNPKTARLYTDVGLLSCHEELGADLTDLFNYLTGYSRQKSYRQLLVAPVNMRSQLLGLIQQEIEMAQSGGEGRIVVKMNAIVDPEMIRMLYRASQAGVSIDLIIRGICCLRPGVAGVSENIRVISVIGRFLEHSRIFYFNHGGQPVVLLGSADWMPRNLNRRVEAVVPIGDPKLIQDLQEILAVMLTDNRQAWDLQSDGTYVKRQPRENELGRSSQSILMDMALQEASLKL